jgi:hypothetical protein
VTLTRKDLAATVLTALAVLTFAATHQGWNVWLVGGSHRWAAVAVALLGSFACGLGTPGKDAATRVLTLLGVVAGVLAVVAIVTGSLTVLSFLTLASVLLWGASLMRHAVHGHGGARLAA